MGNRENAAIGVNLVYKGEILILISTIIGFVSLMLLSGAESIAALGVVGAVFGLVTLVIAIIGFVKEMKGLKRAGKDNDKFAKAFYFVLFCLALSVIASLFQNSHPEWAAGLDGTGTLLDIATAYFVIQGCMELLPNSELAEKGRSLIKWLIAAGIAGAVCEGLQGMQGGMVIIFGIASLVLDLVWYFLYLSYLKNAKDAL